MPRFTRLIVLALLFTSPLTPAFGQADDLNTLIGTAINSFVESSAITPKAGIRESTIDYAVPQSPAFTALGVTPETVIQPTSPRKFATGLLQGLDANGNLQLGLALDTSPYLLFAGDVLTLGAYQNSYVTRLLARTQVSLATSKGASNDDKSVRAGLGLRLTPWDLGDSRNSAALMLCFKSSLEPVHQEANALTIALAPLAATNDPALQSKIDDGLAPLDAKAKQATANCRARQREIDWNASSWSLGAAPTWTSESGDTGNLAWSGVALWSTFGYGFEGVPGLEDTSQFLLHARYRKDEDFPDPDDRDNFFEQDSLTLATQLKLTGPDVGDNITGGPDLHFLLEAAYIKEKRKGRPDEKLFRYAVGAEYKVADNLYFKLSIGTEDGREESDDSGFIMANLKLGFSSGPTK